jgi:L-ascorbate metabolism protein UlaG (beta-lactamase superfamily)
LGLGATALPGNDLSGVNYSNAEKGFLNPEGSLPFLEIEAVLRAHPPKYGDDGERRRAILGLDPYLALGSARSYPGLRIFFPKMIDYVYGEIDLETPTGARIWSMYNQGYVVKTPSHLIGFDIIEGDLPWVKDKLDSLFQKLNVIFISHEHGDHWEVLLMLRYSGFGGTIVIPREIVASFPGIIQMGPGDEMEIEGLQVKAHDGLHSVPVRMYEVTTPEGLTILHTGDNQTSRRIPEGLDVDLLLINGWINDSGRTPFGGDMPAAIWKVDPDVTIPGHYQEIGHAVSSRVPFGVGLEVDESTIPGDLSIQVYGERYDYNVERGPILPTLTPYPTATPTASITPVYLCSIFDIGFNGFFDANDLLEVLRDWKTGGASFHNEAHCDLDINGLDLFVLQLSWHEATPPSI